MRTDGRWPTSVIHECRRCDGLWGLLSALVDGKCGRQYTELMGGLGRRCREGRTTSLGCSALPRTACRDKLCACRIWLALRQYISGSQNFWVEPSLSTATILQNIQWRSARGTPLPRAPPKPGRRRKKTRHQRQNKLLSTGRQAGRASKMQQTTNRPQMRAKHRRTRSQPMQMARTKSLLFKSLLDLTKGSSTGSLLQFRTA